MNPVTVELPNQNNFKPVFEELKETILSMDYVAVPEHPWIHSFGIELQLPRRRPLRLHHERVRLPAPRVEPERALRGSLRLKHERVLDGSSW